MIEDYIPKGYKNRVRRETLETLTRQSDRKIREDIKQALLFRGVLIVNIDNGYFIPDGSTGDKLKAEAYLRREKTRTSSNAAVCKAIEKCLKPPKTDDLTKNQLSLFDMVVSAGEKLESDIAAGRLKDAEER